MSLDHYDVEAIVREEVRRLRFEMRDLISQVERELRELIGTETVERQDADESLGRVINSRTEHLA